MVAGLQFHGGVQERCQMKNAVRVVKSTGVCYSWMNVIVCYSLYILQVQVKEMAVRYWEGASSGEINNWCGGCAMGGAQ